jgi:hypothetical protein
MVTIGIATRGYRFYITLSDFTAILLLVWFFRLLGLPLVELRDCAYRVRVL